MRFHATPYLVSFMLTTSAFLSTVAHATDDKGYAGSQCVQADKGTSISYLDWSRRFNDSTSAMTFDCPIIDDTMGAAIDPARSGLWLIDMSPTAGVTCTLNSVHQTSAAISGWTVSGTYPSPGPAVSTTPIKMSFAGNFGSGNPRIEAAWEFFSCSIPGRAGGMINGAVSGIVSYQVQER